MTHLSRIIVAVAGTIIVACSSTSAQPDDFEVTWSGDTLFARAARVRTLDDSSFAGDLIASPRSVRASRTQTFISDLGADRVAVLDSSFVVVRWIGSLGSGPGELRGVGQLAVRDSLLFVGDALNGRVAAFTLAGEFVRTYPSPFAAGSLSASAMDVFSSARSENEYAMLVDTQPVPHAALRRPPLTRQQRREGRTPMRGHDLLASDSINTWVFDQSSVRLCKYARPDAPPRCVPLPETLVTRLRAYTDDRVRAFERAVRMRVTAAPLVKDMIRFGSTLALLLPLPELPLVLLDVNDGTLTPVVYHGSPLPTWVRSARSFAWDGQGLVLAGDEAIGRLIVARHFDR